LGGSVGLSFAVTRQQDRAQGELARQPAESIADDEAFALARKHDDAQALTAAVGHLVLLRARLEGDDGDRGERLGHGSASAIRGNVEVTKPAVCTCRGLSQTVCGESQGSQGLAMA